MVRRAILDRGDPLTADDEALPISQPSVSRTAPPASPEVRWHGAGGRWLVWIGRAVAWAVLLLIGYRGVAAILGGQGQGTTAGSGHARASARFPAALAEAYALQFGDVYLSFSPATAAQRARSLAAFFPVGSAQQQLGWNGLGSQHLASEQVVAVSVRSSHVAVVTLLGRLASGRLIELGVPVYADHGGMSVSGTPALLPAPAEAVEHAVARSTPDQATETTLRDQLPTFFQAYASGARTTLARLSAPGAHIAGLDGAVRYGAIDSVYAPAGGARREISVTVTWDLGQAPGSIPGTPAASGTLRMVYQLTVVREAGSWDVQSIGASTQLMGPP
jgi:Conjugative transposon protein TcpC